MAGLAQGRVREPRNLGLGEALSDLGLTGSVSAAKSKPMVERMLTRPFPFLLGSVTIPSSCCVTFISKKIPVNRVISYQLANGSICPKAGVM